MSFLTDPFGFKRRRAARQASAQRLMARVATIANPSKVSSEDVAAREKLSREHVNAAIERASANVPFSQRPAVRETLRRTETRMADTTPDAATNLLLNPASPISIYGSGAHHETCAPSHGHSPTVDTGPTGSDGGVSGGCD